MFSAIHQMTEREREWYLTGVILSKKKNGQVDTNASLMIILGIIPLDLNHITKKSDLRATHIFDLKNFKCTVQYWWLCAQCRK